MLASNSKTIGRPKAADSNRVVLMKSHPKSRRTGWRVDPTNPRAPPIALLQSLGCCAGKQGLCRLIGGLLKQQRRALAKNVTLAANEPQPVPKVLALRSSIS